MGGSKKSTEIEPEVDKEKNLTVVINKKRSAVIQIVANLEKDVRHLCRAIPSPFQRRPYSIAEDQAGTKLLETLSELRHVIRNRLHFSARLEYVYASQMAKISKRASVSGESLGRLENRLTEAHQQREECLGVRDSIIASLTEQLDQQRLAMSQAVHSCRAEARREYEEVHRSSENNLEDLKAALEENILTMRSHEIRDEDEELELRRRRQDLEEEIMRRIRHYDATMSSLQTTLDSLREEDKTVTLLLKNKKIEFEAMEKRYEEIEAEKRRIEEERMAAMQAEFRREYAARTIQRAWQHYKMRKMLKKAQRKKKKKPKEK